MEIIRNFSNAVNAIVKNYDPDKIIMFGSQAKGKAGSDSDYDLLIVKRTDTRRLNRREEVLQNIYLAEKIRVT